MAGLGTISIAVIRRRRLNALQPLDPVGYNRLQSSRPGRISITPRIPPTGGAVVGVG